MLLVFGNAIICALLSLHGLCLSAHKQWLTQAFVSWNWTFVFFTQRRNISNRIRSFSSIANCFLIFLLEIMQKMSSIINTFWQTLFLSNIQFKYFQTICLPRNNLKCANEDYAQKCPISSLFAIKMLTTLFIRFMFMAHAWLLCIQLSQLLYHHRSPYQAISNLQWTSILCMEMISNTLYSPIKWTN